MRASSGTLLFGIFAVLFGLLGAYAVRKELHKPVAPAIAKDAAKEDKALAITVPVASLNLEVGRKVTMGDIAILKLTPAQMKAQKISGSFMGSPKQIIGRIVKTAIKEGAAFDTPNFFHEGTGPGVTDRLKPGDRAVTISIEQDAAVAGFAIPGSMVDVLFRADAVAAANNDPLDQLPETTVTLIEAAEVLALNQDTTKSLRVDGANAGRSSQKTSVTLAVTRRQATALQVAEGRGSMSLALRNKNDRGENNSGRLASQNVTSLSQVVSDKVSGENSGLIDEQEATADEAIPKTLDDLLARAHIVHHKMQIYRGRTLKQVHFRNDEKAEPAEELVAERVPASAPVSQTVEQSPPNPPKPSTLTFGPPRSAAVPSGAKN